VLASAEAATLPSTATRLTVYEAAAWLLTRTPYALVTGLGAEVDVACEVDDADACCVGDR
jgi:hypothetical protein